MRVISRNGSSGGKSSIRRIVTFARREDGRLEAADVIKIEKRKKVSKNLRPLEKLLRKWAKPEIRTQSTYLDRHERN